MNNLISAKFGFPEEELERIIKEGCFLQPSYRRKAKDEVVGEMTDEEKAAITFCLRGQATAEGLIAEIGMLAASSSPDNLRKAKLIHDMVVLARKIEMVKEGMCVSVASRFISADKCSLAICSDFFIVVPENPRDSIIGIGLVVGTPSGMKFVGSVPKEIIEDIRREEAQATTLPEDATFH